MVFNEKLKKMAHIKDKMFPMTPDLVYQNRFFFFRGDGFYTGIDTSVLLKGIRIRIFNPDFTNQSSDDFSNLLSIRYSKWTTSSNPNTTTKNQIFILQSIWCTMAR